jgi:hypothetical protein
MRDTISLQIVKFFRYMRLFGTNLFSILRVEGDRIYAIVAWSEDCKDGIPEAEDTQEVVWFRDVETETDDALSAGEYAYDAGWIASDKLTIDEQELKQALGWDGTRVTAAINRLFQIRVAMIDNGVEGDAFFLHR